jgi:hypothetical protein
MIPGMYMVVHFQCSQKLMSYFVYWLVEIFINARGFSVYNDGYYYSTNRKINIKSPLYGPQLIFGHTTPPGRCSTSIISITNLAHAKKKLFYLLF